jgi:hypothetical protein
MQAMLTFAIIDVAVVVATVLVVLADGYRCRDRKDDAGRLR